MSGMQLALVGGRLVLVDARGRPVPPERKITTTAGAMIGSIEVALAAGAQYAAAIGRGQTAAAVQAVADAVARAGAAAGVKAGTTAGVKAGAAAGAKAGAEAGFEIGQRLGHQLAIAESVVERTILRNADGSFAGSVEERVRFVDDDDGD